MSRENVEVVRGAYNAPFGSEEWLTSVEDVAPDFELQDRTLPEVAVGLKGPAALHAEAAYMLDAFEEVSYSVEELRDLDDRVLIRVRGSGRGRGSGIRIDGTLGHLWTLRAGKVVRLDVYGTWEEALEAAGLSEQAMSRENVEMIRAAMDAWNRGDWDEALKDAAPDFVLDNSLDLGEWRGVHRGPDQVKRAWQTLSEPWQSVHIEISEFIEAEEGVIVTRQTSRFVGREGIELPGPTHSGWLWKIRDGKLLSVATYNDLDEALEAAGLSE